MLDNSALTKQPSSTSRRNHGQSKHIYRYTNMNKDSWEQFATQINNNTSKDQVLKMLLNNSIENTKQLNTI